jgi:hypothetical protein
MTSGRGARRVLGVTLFTLVSLTGPQVLADEIIVPLEKMPISKGRYIAGGIVGTAVGFGIGHAINGEYGNIGWLFTVGETGSIAAMFGGMVMAVRDSVSGEFDDRGLTLMALGAIAMSGLRIWEIVDVWTRPVVIGIHVPPGCCGPPPPCCQEPPEQMPSPPHVRLPPVQAPPRAAAGPRFAVLLLVSDSTIGLGAGVVF